MHGSDPTLSLSQETAPHKQHRIITPFSSSYFAMHLTPVHKQVIVKDWNPPTQSMSTLISRNRMVSAIRGNLPNAGGDTKANMITYLQDKFGVKLHKKTLRMEVATVLGQRLQLGDIDVLDQPGNYNHYRHHDHHLH
jgi:hypothetical protein